MAFSRSPRGQSRLEKQPSEDSSSDSHARAAVGSGAPRATLSWMGSRPEGAPPPQASRAYFEPGPPLLLQRAPLSISTPQDSLEVEADWMAAQVTESPAPMRQRPSIGAASGKGDCPSCAANLPCTSCLQPKALPGAAPPASVELGGVLRGGRPLDAATRAYFEPRFSTDFSRVRVHTDGEAAATAVGLDAMAFTVGSDIAFGPGRYAPDSAAGRRLLAHELTHVVQQGGGTPRHGPTQVNEGAHAAASGVVQRSPATDLISSHTSWGNLDEAALGAVLRQRASAGAYDFVQNVLDALGSTDRDDVSYELCVRATEEELARYAENERGRLMLDRLYDELTAGSVSAEENAQADRIMTVKSRRISVAQFAQGIARAKIFPFRLPGLTVMDDAPLSAERRAGGRIWVKQPVRVLGTRMFAAETATLPADVFISGMELPEDEIVGVKLYDMGGPTVYRPALYLVQLANQTDTTILQKMVEVAGIGLTLGTGALVAGSAEATLLARVALWADRAAFVLGTLTSVIQEHRGWILERFGESGKRFLHALDIVNSVVAIYGLGRAVIGAGQLLNGLRRAYKDWRATAAATEEALSTSERGVMTEVGASTDDLLRNTDRIEATARPQGPGAAAAPHEPVAPGAAPHEPAAPSTTAPAEPVTPGAAPHEPAPPRPGSPGEPAAPGTPRERIPPGGIPEAEVEAGLLARRAAWDGVHELKVTKDGVLVRCSPYCTRLGDIYKEQLALNREAQAQLRSLENRAAAAARNRGSVEAKALLDDLAQLEKSLSDSGFKALRTRFPSLSEAQVATLQGKGIDPTSFEKLLTICGGKLDDALLLAETGGYLGVRAAEQAVATGGTLDDVFKAVEEAAGVQPGIRPSKSIGRNKEDVHNFPHNPRDPAVGNTAQSFERALEDARLQSGTAAKEFSVPFVQELGKNKGMISGRMTPDGKSGWRLDWDPNPATGKGFHINWWHNDGKNLHQGANVVRGGNEAQYLKELKALNQ